MNTETATLLETHFDFAFAGPKGVQKLRELILMLAMQGKLVPQDPNDRPAGELLKEIGVARQRLAEEGKFKDIEPENNKVSANLFSIPENWTWCYLNDISAIARGGSPRPIDEYITEDPNGLNWIKIGDSDRGSIYIDKTKERIRPEGLKKTRMVFPGDLILSNSMSFGYPYILNIEGCIHDGWLLIRIPENLVSKLFIYYLFLSSYVKAAFNKAAAGAVVQNLNAEKVRQLPIPLPPIAEQHRIVAKIEQLMSRCDELETLRNDRNQKRTHVHTAAIDRLLTAKADGDFQMAWTFISNHFSELYSVKENVAELRKAILQLAVMGKLVPQDPTDEPASELLKAIEIEKQRLVKEGQIKKPKLWSEIKPDEVPYELSKGWKWVRFEEVANARLGKMLDAAKNRGMPRPYLRNTNVQWYSFDLSDIKLMKFEDEELDEFRVMPGDLLICEGGEPGRCAIWSDSLQEIYFQKAIHRARTYSGMAGKYLQLCLTIDAKTERLNRYFTGATIKHFSGEKLSNYLVPLPPTSEQHRIVAKIDRLMELCDRLDQQIEAAKTKQTELLNSLMAKV